MNKILKGLVFNDQISVSVLETTELVNDAIRIHGLTPLTSATLGRTLTMCAFMSSNLKNEKDKVSLSIVGDGVGGKIFASGNDNLDIRGYIDNPKADLPLKSNGKLDVAGCVGKNGRITVSMSMGLKEPYSGSSQIVSGEIAEDFTAYYAYSEQQPTAIALGVKIGKDLSCVGAGGVILQTLPFADDENIKKAEEIVKKLSSLSTLIEEKGAEGVLKEFFGDVSYTEYHPKYRCICSRKYIEEVLISLGKKELDEIINTQGKIKVDCQFCNKEYLFFKNDVDKLFDK